MYRKKSLSSDDFISYDRKRSIIHHSDDDKDTYKVDSVGTNVLDNFGDIGSNHKNKDKVKMDMVDPLDEVDYGYYHEYKNDENLAGDDE
jgi:hypothetical protein